MKRSFASLAKLVILQEKLRKGKEIDANDEEDGEISSYLARGVAFACFPRVHVGSLQVPRLPLTVQILTFGMYNATHKVKKALSFSVSLSKCVGGKFLHLFYL